MLHHNTHAHISHHPRPLTDCNGQLPAGRHGLAVLSAAAALPPLPHVLHPSCPHAQAGNGGTEAGQAASGMMCYFQAQRLKSVK